MFLSLILLLSLWIVNLSTTIQCIACNNFDVDAQIKAIIYNVIILLFIYTYKNWPWPMPMKYCRFFLQFHFTFIVINISHCAPLCWKHFYVEMCVTELSFFFFIFYFVFDYSLRFLFESSVSLCCRFIWIVCVCFFFVNIFVVVDVVVVNVISSLSPLFPSSNVLLVCECTIHFLLFSVQLNMLYIIICIDV